MCYNMLNGYGIASPVEVKDVNCLANCTYLDNSAKECLGINYLENELLKTGIVESNIPRKDKATSWDGSISIYNSVPFSKETLIDEIPVQVKCRTCNSYSNRISISVADMKNYEKKLKALYFVVMLKDDDYKIYYKPLLLWDINRFLIDSQGQESMTTDFEELPLGSADELKNILINFVHESENQKQMIPGVASMEQLMAKIPNGKATFHINVPASFNGNDVLSAIHKEKPYLYYHSDQLNLNFVVDRLQGVHLGFGRHIDVPVGVGELRNLYRSYELIQTENGFTCKIGPNITGHFSDNKTTFNYKVCGNIDERIKTLQFMRGLFNGDTLHFGNIDIPSDKSVNRDSEIQKIDYSLSYCLDLQKLTKQIGLLKELSLDTLSDAEQRNLYDFLRSELYGEEVALGIGKSGNAFLRLGDINILCYCQNLENGKNHIYSIFHKDLLLLASEQENGEKISVSKYFVLLQEGENGFELVDNINYDDMLEDIQIYLNNDYAQDMSVQLLLKLLCFYDKAKHSKSIEAAIKLSEVLFDYDNRDINFINKCQAYKRTRALFTKEKEVLLSIKDTATDFSIKCACCILLESKEEYLLYFEKMNEEAQNIFKQFPIYNLL